jgi:uncharacterized protein (TIGR00299 family) protein
MKIAYLDCFAGVSGDMLLGALVDAGLPEEFLLDCIDSVNIDGIDLQIQLVQKGAIKATKANLAVSDHKTERNLKDIQEVIDKSRLPKHIKDKSNSIFTEIAEVEAGIHNKEVSEVHLHELGGIDTILDVTCVLSGFEHLSIERVVSSPLPFGYGVQNSAHGLIPIPAPATTQLLKGVPVIGKEIQAELVTPTGAALVKSLTSRYGRVPPMQLETVGYGAGDRDHEIPNVLRMLIGSQNQIEHTQIETLCMLETNIDDLNPEIYDYLMKELFEHGALDVYLTPIQMKKNRPGSKVSVLCALEDFDKLARIMFIETSTTGIRKMVFERYSLPRKTYKIILPYGEVRIKSITTPGGNKKYKPEYEDCQRLAKSQGIPILDVYQAAHNAAQESDP